MGYRENMEARIEECQDTICELKQELLELQQDADFSNNDWLSEVEYVLERMADQQKRIKNCEYAIETNKHLW